MANKAYALLVGIDAYRRPVPALRGCLNDVSAMEELLSRLTADRYELELKILRDEDATREGIIDGFREHLGQASEGDVAFFYYSGHGSQEQAPPELWAQEPDHLNETLVCYDSRAPGGHDLADKEIATLLAEVAKASPHVIVVLDCCHSGSATRGEDDEGVRRAPTDRRGRSIDEYLASVEQMRALQPSSTGTLGLARGRHVVLSACQSHELARETRLGGTRRGVFSYHLTHVLERHGCRLSYRDVFKRVSALVRARRAQSPVMEASVTEDLTQAFLGGTVDTGGRYLTASWDVDAGWVIDGGAVHGIQPVAGTETTHLALFPIDTKASELSNPEASVGRATVTKTLGTQSTIAIDFEADQTRTYKAVVTSVPLPLLGVELSGDDEGVRRLRAELGEEKYVKRSLVHEVDEGAGDLVVVALDTGYRIRRPGEAHPLVVDVEGTNDEAVRTTIERLEHMARWIQVAELANPNSQLPPTAVTMELIGDDDAPLPLESGALRLTYRRESDRWVPPRFRIKLTNTTDRRLYCMLLDLTETYGILATVLEGTGVWLDPGQEAWALGGRTISAKIPDELWKAGVIEFRDLLKLIVSTDEGDATLLAQEQLDVQLRTRSVPETPRNTLERLLARVQTRNLGASDDDDAMTDWTASEIMVTTTRPSRDVSIPKSVDQSAEVRSGVELFGHPSLRAKVRLSTAAFASRSADRMSLPADLGDRPDLFGPLSLSSARGGEPGLSVIELFDVENHDAVTPQAPLRLRATDLHLSEDEYVLPLALDRSEDGDLFIPLGHGRMRDDALEIELQRLPEPEAEDTRSLVGSIRIYLEKVVVKRLGGEFRYPLLAALEPSDDGPIPLMEMDDVRQRVAEADRILLFIHGIIGDTKDMGARAFAGPQPLAENYDLVLTFDYENLGTTIETIATELGARLAEAGLGAGHSKQLHVVAHSMGGLVSRWFIERAGGREVVQRLVMVGTPNGGSPWPHIEDWATTALGLGLNHLGAIAWPATVLASLVRAADRAVITLDQMERDSGLLQALASSGDPQVPYGIVAGNTSLIERPVEKTRLRRLFARLEPRRLLHGLTALAFFEEPNDIAVSVKSIKSVPPNPGPSVVEDVACDHLSYFNTEIGRAALRRVLDAM